ncbi:MAG: RecX family transcriptional regulator [Chitinophagaceae bacterium]
MKNAFAIQYAGGKFRMNQWGRVKIKYALRQKQVSEYSIKKGLKEIGDADYKKPLQKLAVQKLKSLKSETNIFSKKKSCRIIYCRKGMRGVGEGGSRQELAISLFQCCTASIAADPVHVRLPAFLFSLS